MNATDTGRCFESRCAESSGMLHETLRTAVMTVYGVACCQVRQDLTRTMLRVNDIRWNRRAAAVGAVVSAGSCTPTAVARVPSRTTDDRERCQARNHLRIEGY